MAAQATRIGREISYNNPKDEAIAVDRYRRKLSITIGGESGTVSF
jgi:hypothetical protein